MVGTCTALHLARRGHSVVLVDRKKPGRETSYGNAGVIQCDVVEPYPFPRDISTILRVAFKQGIDVNYHFGALPSLLPKLARYWWESAPERYRQTAREWSRLVAQSVAEHSVLIDEARADDLVNRDGYRFIYRTDKGFQDAISTYERLAREYGLSHSVMSGAALATAEPILQKSLAGALHLSDPWSVRDPGELVARYAQLFKQNKGEFYHGDAKTLRQVQSGWSVSTEAGTITAQHAVIALGPWADEAIKPLGYKLPLFVKRGYHRHYVGLPMPNLPLLDAERGYVIAPMSRGLRITTGAEFAKLGDAPTPKQLYAAEDCIRELLDLATPVEAEPWLGNRPCTADMKPVVGAAPKHPGLWFNFGHAHQGFTLGPVTGRMITEMIEGKTPFIDPAPYAPSRF